MKIVMLGDLHGNGPATRAMEDEIRDIAPDEVWFLGDAVGKGPENAFTCDWVREHCTTCVGGNWDYGIGGKEFEADNYYWDQLGSERMAWLNGLPRETELLMSGVRFRLFHGRPVTELMVVQDRKEKLAPIFTTDQGVYGGVLFADSHRPFLRTLNEGYMVNTGSIGNSMGIPKSHGLLIEGVKDSPDPASLRFTILSVPYDNEAAAEIARRDPDLPHKDAYIREVLTGIYSR